MSQKNKNCEIVGIGSPLLDITLEVDEETLDKMDFKKGSMNLISKDQSLDIENEIRGLEKKISPGGSSANTISGVNALGTKAGFVGVVGDDEYGKEYQKQTEKEGVVSHLKNHEESLTGHAFTFITPDGERTFATHLGAASKICKEHISKELIQESQVLHIEAYQLEDPLICGAIFHAIAIAKDSGTKISLDLSDASLIERNKAMFKDVVVEHVDILFANEDEAKAFTGKNETEALDEFANLCEFAVVKIGERGSLIKHKNKVFQIKPKKVEVENTNGAGDMYAAGILHGIVSGLSPDVAGELASHASSVVVSSTNARANKKHIDSILKR